jgi:predicted Zn-dependent protease
MLARDRVEEIVKQALAASKADETEVVLGGGRLHVVRLEAGALAENRGEEWYELRIRVHRNGRVGVARTGRVDREAVERAVARAAEAADASAPSPRLLPMVGPQKYPESTHYDPQVAQLAPAARLAYVMPLLLDARKHGARASGLFAARAGSLGTGGVPGLLAMANSRGLFVYHRTTRLRLDARVDAGDGSGWGEAEHWLARGFDPAPAVTRALTKALAARRAEVIEPGVYEAILEPAAMATVLRAIAPHFSARAAYDGGSFVAGLRAVAAPNITVHDDFAHPLHAGLPFDGEGMPRRKVTLLEKGRVKEYFYSREMARRYGLAPTGHAPLQPAYGEAVAEHLVMEGEERSVEELIASCERGILVSRLGYHRELRREQAVCAGVTRDGTYWIEGGKVRHALANLRYEVGMFELLHNAVALSRPEKALGVVAPALRTRRFRVLGVAS